MILQQPRIVVIGAGILGSAIAYNLAIRGAHVVLLDEGPRPGSGVTGHAFGWINVINGTPSDASYPLWRQAVAEYQRLRAALPEAFSQARTGSLLWRATAQETEQLADLHQQAGEDVELVKAGVVARWEPRLRCVPEYAVFSRQDIALDPAQLAETLVAAAVAAGASLRLNETVVAIETTNGQASGIRTSDQIFSADIVVMAAAGGIRRLAAGVGIDTGIATSPALLLRYACDVPVINHILRGSRLEVRQAGNGMLFVAKSYVGDGSDNAPWSIGERILDVMKDELHLPAEVVLVGADVGQRPMFADGLPRLGFLPQVAGLYVASGHPGIILAPLLGRLAAEHMLEGREIELIPSPQ
jgi:glycine/D-amino acid oxidase-like deaminating enzyme